MKSKIFLSCMLLLLSSCGLFDNIKDSPRAVVNTDRDYILNNETPHPNLLIYISRVDADDCTKYKLVATMQIHAKYPLHVSPGETIYVRYCASQDVVCLGCRLRKLIGNTETYGNDIILQ